MSETIPDHQPGQDGRPAEEQYRHGSINYKLRWEVYKYTSPPLNIHGNAVAMAELSGDETVLDVGMGDGSLLREYVLGGGHHGMMVGVDSSEDMVYQAQMISASRNEPIEFMNMSAEDLQFDDNSFDTAFAMFVLYHTNTQKALSELKRVVRSDGKIVIATSGHLNKFRHRAFEKKIAEWLSETALSETENSGQLQRVMAMSRIRKAGGVRRPQYMNKPFDTKAAEVILPQMFDEIERYPAASERCKMHVALFSADNIEVYYDSIRSMQSMFYPTPPINLFNEAIDAVVKPVVEKELSPTGNGYFRDMVQRDVFACRNR